MTKKNETPVVVASITELVARYQAQKEKEAAAVAQIVLEDLSEVFDVMKMPFNMVGKSVYLDVDEKKVRIAFSQGTIHKFSIDIYCQKCGDYIDGFTSDVTDLPNRLATRMIVLREHRCLRNKIRDWFDRIWEYRIVRGEK